MEWGLSLSDGGIFSFRVFLVLFFFFSLHPSYPVGEGLSFFHSILERMKMDAFSS